MNNNTENEVPDDLETNDDVLHSVGKRTLVWGEE